MVEQRENVDVPVFVLDTHALYWYLGQPQRLSVAADAVFRLAEAGGARLIVPAITIAELYYLTVKVGHPVAPSVVLDALKGVDAIEVSDRGEIQLRMLDQATDVPEMHDRLIAAEALSRNAAVVTRDESLARSTQIATVWLARTRR